MSRRSYAGGSQNREITLKQRLNNPREITPSAPARRFPLGRRRAGILGRIDLRRTMPVAPAPSCGSPVGQLSQAYSGSRAQPPQLAKRVRHTQAEGGEKRSSSKGRTAQEAVVRTRRLESARKSRSGRIPKKRGASGKEQRKTEITVPRASKRVIRIPKDHGRRLSRRWCQGRVIKLMGMGDGDHQPGARRGHSGFDRFGI